jgi:hypothetical protein
MPLDAGFWQPLALSFADHFLVFLRNTGNGLLDGNLNGLLNGKRQTTTGLYCPLPAANCRLPFSGN